MATSSKSGQSGLQVERARHFADLHKFGDPLLLPNAWDVASAVMIAKYGATAIATSSAGVAWSLGVSDGGYLGADRAAAVVEAIVRSVSIPVSADIEDGYGSTPEAVSITAEAVIRAGAVGVNLEDSSPRGGVALFDSHDQSQRIAAVRAIADRLAVPVWINARTDVFLVQTSDPMAEARKRASVYARAGANSLFVPGLIDPARIAELSTGPLPIAVMVWSGAAHVQEFAKAGAVRISLGPAIAQAAYQVAARATVELVKTGTYSTTKDGVSVEELNSAMRSCSRDRLGRMN